MSVWLCIPSKRPLHEVGEVLAAWKECGYKIALTREAVDGRPSVANVCLPVYEYQGWARSTNLLIATVMAADRDAEWFIGGGDDYWPDPTKTADDIAEECLMHFAEAARERSGGLPWMGTAHLKELGLFGVMQPTGDRWMDRGDGQGAVIDRIAGSPWMGREFCRRMYHGSGPMYNGYYHNFADEELQNVAQQLGVFWQRRDLTQEHRHWARPRGDWRDAPDWARKINDPQQSDWERSKALFAKRKAAGFLGSEPLEL